MGTRTKAPQTRPAEATQQAQPADEAVAGREEMKLENPTDNELNVAFAEKVAGWTFLFSTKNNYWIANSPDGEHHIGRTWIRFDCETGKPLSRPEPWEGIDIPRFSLYADAVMPWLEKMPTAHIHWDGKFYKVHVSDRICPYGLDESFPKAAVIALLRAHGVEVEWIESK